MELEKIDFHDWRFLIDVGAQNFWLAQAQSDAVVRQASPTLLSAMYMEKFDLANFRKEFYNIHYESLNSLEKIKFHFLKAYDLRLLALRSESLNEIAQARAIQCDDPRKANVLDRLVMLEAAVVGESGDIYRSASLFATYDQLSANSPYLSQMRVNELVLLLDLGQIELFKLKIPYIHPDLQDMFILYYECAKGTLNLVRKWLKNGIPECILPSTHVNIIDVMIQAVIILGNEDDLALLRKSWITDRYLDFIKRGYKEDVAKDYLLVIGAIDGDKLNCVADPNWMHHKKLAYIFREVMFNIGKNHDKAISLLQNEVREICLENKMMNPQFPFLIDHEWFPESAWSEGLSKKLNLQNIVPKLFFVGQNIFASYFDKEYKIDFPKSPKSTKVIEFIVENKKVTLRKFEVHAILSSKKYLGREHDSRVYKMLSRINQKLEMIGLPDLFSLDGEKINILYKV